MRKPNPTVNRVVIFLLALALGTFAWLYYNYIRHGYGAVVEQWETSNPSFKVRVQVRPALGSFMQYYYIFQAAPAGSEEWRDVAVRLVDEPGHADLTQARVVNDRVGCFFLYHDLAVTIDGGRTWRVNQFKLPLPDRESELWSIKEVQINPDGTGTARLRQYDYKAASYIFREARTTDFGLSWRAE